MFAEIRRYLSYFVLAILSVWIWNAWLRDYPPVQTPAVSQTTTAENSNLNSFTPTAFNPGQNVKSQIEGKIVAPTSVLKTATNVIHVKTDVLDVDIDPSSGSIVSAFLPKYPVSLQDKNPVELLSSDQQNLYVAQSGLVDAADNNALNIKFKADKTNYVLQDNQQNVVVNLIGTTNNGLTVTKQYIFTRGQYPISLNYSIKNTANKTWSGSLYTQLIRRKPPAEAHHMGQSHYVGAAISSTEIPYKKLPFDDFDSAPVNDAHAGGWVAMLQQYFLSAWIPATQNQSNHYYTHSYEPSDGSSPVYTIGFTQPAMNIAAGQTATSSAQLFIGPEIDDILKNVAPGLDHTIDYGWLWPVSVLLFWLLAKVEWVVGNWGWAIVITTILIKLLFHPFTAKTIRHGHLMRDMQPKIKALKDRFGDDKQGLSKATMELYKKEGMNPLGGCLPMLVQIPVFIALYYVLIASVDLRQAPFILWIHDLSIKDPYYVLPILMGVSMFLQQKLTPSTMDPAQQKIMLLLPVVFTVVFLNFPSGLALYWFVSNIVQVCQQWYILKTHDKYTEKQKAKRNNKKRKA